MPISYTKRGWTNNSPPAINAANLGAMDDGIKQACDAVDTLNVAPVAHAASHKHGGADEIATATPAANAIPKADSSGKLDSWVSDASTSVKGKVQLATADELEIGTDASKVLTPAVVRPAIIKRTKMPDGATALYCPLWTSGTDGWGVDSNCTLSASNGVLTMTATGSPAVMRRWFTTDYSGKVVYVEYKSTTQLSFLASSVTVPAASDWTPLVVQLKVITSAQNIWVTMLSSVSGDVAQFRNLWIGDYNYLNGTLSEMAARDSLTVANVPAVGACASGTVTATDSVANGNTVTIYGNTYTFKTALTPAEGEVLIGASATESLANLALAINRTSPELNDGVKYKIAAAHPLVSASASGTTLTITALQPGELGNQITLAKNAATLTLSGSTLSGGYSATAKKLATLAAPIIAGNGTRPAAAQIELTDTAKIGYENTVDVASGGTVTLPTGGTWIWAVFGYGATISGGKRGSSAGGTVLTVSGANATVWYRRYA